MKKCILVVDDDPRIRRMLAARLQKLGYDVALAESGKHAIEIIKAQPIALVLLDQRMQEMDGIETYKNIRPLAEPYMPMIMLTAHGSIKLALAFLQVGGVDFEEKPVDFTILQIKIERAIQSSEKIRREVMQRKNAEVSLKIAHDELEKRVRERTADLLMANDKLKKQMAARKQAEKDLKQKEVELRHAHKMESIGRLAGGISHDFNNILTAILGYCEFLKNDLPAGDQKKNDVKEIAKAAERASALTRQLLAYSRRQAMLPKVIDLNAAKGYRPQCCCR